MKYSLSREEAEKLLGTIGWVLAATLPSEEERLMLIRIHTKLKMCLSENKTEERLEIEVI